jgi:PRC-barrel domain
MKKLPICCGLIAALGFAGAAFAQETQKPTDPDAASERLAPADALTGEAQNREASETTPSTSKTAGAADRASPGDTPPVSGRTARSPATAEGSGEELVGASVVTRTNAPLGQVTEVVFDSKQQPAFVIISTEDQSSAVPYAAASSMMSGDKVVIDQSRLQAAPKLKQGEWKHQSDAKWQADAARYWNRG